MHKSKKFVKHNEVEEQSYVDSDELQHLDECDCEWVEAWQAAADDLTELRLDVLSQEKKQERPVGIKKRGISFSQ